MKNQKNITAILLLGGEGKRFGHLIPKQFLPLSGKKIYLHTLEKFLAVKIFEEVILVCHENWVQDVLREIQREFPHDPIKVISAGPTRQMSSFLGILACKEHTRIVVIHDGVRPFVSQKMITENIEAAEAFGAVDTCIPSADTIIQSSLGESIDGIPDRKEYFRGQTPQSFSYPVILKAHRYAQAKHLFEASDDCRLVLESGHAVHIVQGEESNIKITSELDLFLAEQLMGRQVSTLPPTATRNLEGKHYAITGGTGGIGKAIAKRLESEGAIPILISLSAPYFPADLTSLEEVKKTFQKIYHQYGRLDGLINSIGALHIDRVTHLTEEAIEKQIAVNFKSVVFSCKSAQIKEGGHLVNISSSSYFRGRKNYAIYSATKAAVVNFSQAFALEHPELNVNVVVPQRTNTPLRQKHFPLEDPASLLSPEEVADHVISLLKQNQITGSLFEVKRKIPSTC